MDELAPIAATVAVDRRAPVKSSRSTLATMADLEPYLAGLFGREAIPTCPTCGLDAVDTSPRDAAARLAASHAGRARDRDLRASARTTPSSSSRCARSSPRDGYRRLVVGGVVREIDEVRPSEATAPGVRVEVVVDRVSVRPGDARRLQEAIETAWAHGGGRAELRVDESATGHVTIRRGLVCPEVRAPVRAAAAGPLLLQLALRRVRRVPGLRARHRGRLGQGHPRSEPVAQGRRRQALERRRARRGSAGSSRSSARPARSRSTSRGKS